LAECVYRSEVATFHEKLWQAGRTIRSILEKFRAAEHKRVTALHGALRVFVSLQQRLWADISASTSAVHAIFKDRTAATALGDQPATLAIETLTTSEGNGEYVARPPPPLSLLVAHEGRLQYQRSIVRTWATCYAVLTSDRFMHCFSLADEPPHSSRVRSSQLLFSVRCARGAEPLDASSTLAALSSRDAEWKHSFEVTTRVDGILSKTGLSSGRGTMTFRTPTIEDLQGWLEAVREVCH